MRKENMKKKIIIKIFLGVLAFISISGCSSTLKEDPIKAVEETENDTQATFDQNLNVLGIHYKAQRMPAWGINADIPVGWSATVDHEKSIVFFTSNDTQYEGIEISFKHTYNGSNVPSLLRKDFDYYYLYDFIYYGKDKKNYHTTDYEPQTINVIKDESQTVWVDADAENYTGSDERGDPNSYYMEYKEQQEGMNLRKDKKIIAVHENPKLVLMEDKSRELLDNCYMSAYYFGYAESERAVALTVIGSKEQSHAVDDIAKTIAYSINRIDNTGQIESISLEQEINFAGTTFKIPSIKAANHISLTDDYTSSFFHTKIINTVVTNDSGLSFKDFYQSEKLSQLIETEFYNKQFKNDQTTKSAAISGGIVEEKKIGQYDAIRVSMRTETRSSKASIKELIRSKDLIHYSDIMLVDLGNHEIGIFAITSPHIIASSSMEMFEKILK